MAEGKTEPVITVCIESVDESGGIKITFKNNTEDDLSILKWYTPLEGTMTTPFFTVRDETGEELEYSGLMAKRVSNPTCEDFEVIPSGNSVTSNTIHLDDTYDIEEGIKYTIEYTGSIEYIAGSIKLTEVISEDLNEQEMTEAGKGIMIEVKHIKKLQLIKSNPEPGFFGGTQEQYSCTQQLLEELKDPKRGYQRVIEAVHPTNLLYRKWFGEYDEKRAKKVRKVYQNCCEGLKENKIRYVFNDNETIRPESTTYAYYKPSANQIGFTSLYNTIPERGAGDSKLQTLVHELSHAYGKTKDANEGYGVNNCLQMATNRPDAAVKNADSYGYFYCDVAVSLEERITFNF